MTTETAVTHAVSPVHSRASASQAEKLDTPQWHNIKAPDARTTRTATVSVPAGRRELAAFLRNPNALFGLVFLSLMVAAALIAPLAFP
ncbi:MAG: hypothetical protein EOP21_05445, partial [Hyphomicrobiales bacterium]